jgi:hypothetical protein
MLTEGRLRVLHIDKSGLIFAECRDDSGEMYSLAYNPERRAWHCMCPAKGRCSHIIALQLVTTVPVAASAVA